MSNGSKTDTGVGSVLLAGSSAERVCCSIRERYPLVTVEVVPVAELPETGPKTIAVICPSDGAEFHVNSRSISSRMPASSRPVILCPAGIETPSGGPWIILREGPFAVAVLANMIFLGFPIIGPSPVYDFLTLARSGVLLPFFFHNINNILTRVMGNVELAGYDLENREKLVKRLRNALDGTEELRMFLSDLSLVIHSGGEGPSDWTAASADEVFRTTRMSSGTSVEFTHFMDPLLPKYLPVDRNQLNTLLGAVSSAATLFVNGCGSVNLGSSLSGYRAVFTMKWRSTSGDRSRSDHQIASAIALLAWTASLSPPAGVTFELDEWRVDEGLARIIVETTGGTGEGGAE